MNSTWPKWLVALMLIGGGDSILGPLIAGAAPPSHWRRPVALVVVDNGRQLVTANQRSGSLSLLDLDQLKVDGEVVVGQQLSDLATVPADETLLLTTDEVKHELIAVRRQGATFAVMKRLAVSPYPVTVRIAPDSRQAFVASLWSRTISVVDISAWLGDPGNAVSVREILLPFAPREMLFIDEQRKLIVADAFGSRLAVLNVADGFLPDRCVESIKELPAHAIRQMRLHPTKPRLVMTHQMMSRLAHTTFDDVHWGSLMTNCLRSLPMANVLDPKAKLLEGSVIDYLGGPERGAGDPAGFVLRADGALAVALSGTNELLLDDGKQLFSYRLPMEDHPTAVALSLDGQRVFVANSLSDSVTVVDLTRRQVLGNISLGPHPELTAADRGERLFHNAKVSHDGWFSCASCHIDGHTNGQLNDNFTDGSFGSPKRVLSLRGVADTAPYAWSGRFETLTEQIEHSVRSTMQGEPLNAEAADDLAVFLRTLPPPPLASLSKPTAVARGAAVFEKLKCARCHTGPTFTSSQIVDVKLRDEQGHSQFNPPSLRGVSHNASFFHDGRANALEDVVKKFRHQIDIDLTPDEMQDLITFLASL